MSEILVWLCIYTHIYTHINNSSLDMILFYSNMTVSLCIRQGSKRNDDSVSVEELDWSEHLLNTSGVTLNTDLEPKTHHQTPMTCTYGYSHFIHFKTTEVEIECLITRIMFPSLLPQFGSAFSLLKKGVSQYFCPYNECTSRWCLVMSFFFDDVFGCPNCCYKTRSTQFPRISFYA